MAGEVAQDERQGAWTRKVEHDGRHGREEAWRRCAASRWCASDAACATRLFRLIVLVVVHLATCSLSLSVLKLERIDI